MRNSSRFVPTLTRGVGVALVAVASLQLALRTAEALFLHRRGSAGDGVVPIAAWLGVVVLGLVVYGRGASRRPSP